MAEGGHDYCLSQEEVKTFLTTKPENYRSPDKTCLLMMTKNESGEVVQFNGKNIHRFEGKTGSGKHAEINALDELRKSKDEMQKQKITEILFIINYSPCSGCKDDIIVYCDANLDIKINIYFAGLYMPPRIQQYETNKNREKRTLDVLASLDKHQQIQIQNIYGCYWKSLILAKNPITDFKPFWHGQPELVERTLQNVIHDRGLAEYKVEKRKEKVNPITNKYEWEEESITSTAFLDAILYKIDIIDELTFGFNALSLKK